MRRVGATASAGLFSLVFCISTLTTLHGQTTEQRAALLEFSVQQDKVWHQQRAEAESLARVLNIPVRAETPGGGVIELQKIVDGRAYYYRTTNLNAAKTLSTNKVWPGGTGGFSLTGLTDTLAIWDANKARQTHQELNGRVIYSDAGTTTHAHSTHVAGTMIAGGVDANAKGMSYQGRLKSYDWNSDLSEMATAAAGGLRVSNHSYGLITGWYDNGLWHWYGDPSISTSEAYLYGFYTSDVQAVDNIAVNAPFYLITKSAGNDRFEGPSSQPVTHSHSGSGSFTDSHNLSGAPSGYDCISDFGVAKNVLTVGAVNDIAAGYSVPSDVVMSSFSSWGPVDDGRIKPDIVGNGINVYSCTNISNTSYDGTYSGTSMASPNVSGSLGLLLQLRKNIAGASNPMRSSTLRGLAIHTADESGSNPGPDYSFGWGLMNTLKAAQVMRTDSAAGMNKNIRELILSQGQTIDVTVNSDGSQALRATICWIDPAGTPPAPALDPTTLMLVNDLDLRIINGVTTYSPWVLNPASPSSAATTGDNTRDNLEQVHIASPSSGQYTVRITHKGTLSGGSQAVSLIITGGTFGSGFTVTSPNGGESWRIGSSQTIIWTSSGVSSTVNIDLSTNGGTSFPTPLFANVANSGSLVWTVTGPAVSTARVRVSSYTNASIRDSSNANFTMFQPTITVTSPNGGELWPIASSQAITWTWNGVSGGVNIDLSTNGGTSFPIALASNTTNSGSYPWTVTGPAVSTARVRISSYTDASIRDSSNANFTMIQPTIRVTAPNGGEQWAIGSSQNTTWTSSNLSVSSTVKIELSTNGGSTFPTVLSTSTANDGTEPWTVSGPVSSSARIRISSLLVSTVIDTSNADFSVVQPAVTVTSPNGGEPWAIGSSQNITWASSNLPVGSTVKIELSTNGGSTFPTVLFAVTDNDGTEQWTVSASATSSARIRISSLAITSVADTSNGNFNIIQPSITVTVPNGGETWGIGTTHSITWTSLGVTGDVKIELSRNGGGIYETLFASTQDDGTEEWVVTSPVTSNGLMRISSVSAPSVFDTSNGEFTISSTAVYSIVEQGWNMLSVPVTVVDRRKTAVFPTSISNAFGYLGGGYVVQDTLGYGEGYWLKFPSSQPLSVFGDSRSQDTIDVVQGWNMIGSISSTVLVGNIIQIPTGIVVSSYFGYSSTGYSPATSIDPMRGYWVKVSQVGKLVLSGAIARPSAKAGQRGR